MGPLGSDFTACVMDLIGSDGGSSLQDQTDVLVTPTVTKLTRVPVACLSLIPDFIRCHTLYVVVDTPQRLAANDPTQPNPTQPSSIKFRRLLESGLVGLLTNDCATATP